MFDKHRRSIRLEKYNYSNNGWYFITVCTQNRECLFGNVINGQMILNNIGIIFKKLWNKIPERFNMVELDEFQIMPNHIHGIIIIVGAGFMPALIPKIKRATTRVAPTTTIVPTTVGDIIGAFKSLTTHEYIMNVKNHKWPPFEKRLWQRNYYEHIIRNEYSLNKIRQYIRDNPKNWNEDRNNIME